jgi:predicted dehydrogenase
MKPDRRAFLKTTAAAMGAAVQLRAQSSPNSRLQAAFIGVGEMGSYNLSGALKIPDVQVVAVCDVYQPHLERAAAIVRRAGQQAREITDFRQVIADRSIDVVCISTPDHWHAFMAVEACKAGILLGLRRRPS